MEVRAHYALIGVFVVATILSAFGFIYWFSGTGRKAQRVPYRIIFTGSVSGLSEGSHVLFNGVKVGEVRDIELMSDDPGRVSVIMDVDRRLALKTDTGARLEIQGVTGAAVIALAGGSMRAPPLQGVEGNLPTIYGDRSQLQSLLETVQHISQQSDSILEKINVFVGDNHGYIRSTIVNIENFSRSLSENADGVRRFLMSLGNMGDAIGPATQRIENLAARLDLLLTSVEPDKVQMIVSNVQETSVHFNKTSEKLQSLMAQAERLLGKEGREGMFEDMNKAVVAIKQLADNLDQRTKTLSVVFRQSLNNFDQTLGSVGSFMNSLKYNPDQILFGRKPRIPEYNAR